MKKIWLPIILLPLSIYTSAKSVEIADHSKPTVQIAQSQTNNAELNKKIVTDFYNGVFIKHQVKAYSDRYIGTQYIQHNPYVPNGKAPFVTHFTQYFKEHPEAKNVIKRAIAQDDLVMLHVHSTENPQDQGKAIVDIFRVENGKIVEHWDVQQSIPEKSANTNTMF